MGDPPGGRSIIVEGVHRGTRVLQAAQAPCPSLSASSEPTPNARVPPRLPLGEDAREGLGAGRGGGRGRRREGQGRKGVRREGFILSIVICQRRNPRHACLKVTHEGRALEGRAREGRGVGRCGGRVSRHEERERKGVHREGFIFPIAICQRRNSCRACL